MSVASRTTRRATDVVASPIASREPIIGGGGGGPVYHPDVVNWQSRVAAAGGSASPSTLAALSTFATAIETAEIRDRFFRLNVFCGNDLTTALVPFYRGPANDGTQYGFEYDQNNGPFASDDWVEGAGLTGDGVSFLDTNLSPSQIAVLSGHYSADRRTTLSPKSTLIGAWESGSAISGLVKEVGGMGGRWGGNQPASFTGGELSGLFLFCRRSANARTLYLEGTPVATNNNNTPSDIAITTKIVVFARRIVPGGEPSEITIERLGGYSIGAAMDDSQSLAFSTAWIALRSALGR